MKSTISKFFALLLLAGTASYFAGCAKDYDDDIRRLEQQSNDNYSYLVNELSGQIEAARQYADALKNTLEGELLGNNGKIEQAKREAIQAASDALDALVATTFSQWVSEIGGDVSDLNQFKNDYELTLSLIKAFLDGKGVLITLPEIYANFEKIADFLDDMDYENTELKDWLSTTQQNAETNAKNAAEAMLLAYRNGTATTGTLFDDMVGKLSGALLEVFKGFESNPADALTLQEAYEEIKTIAALNEFKVKFEAEYEATLIALITKYGADLGTLTGLTDALYAGLGVTQDDNAQVQIELAKLQALADAIIAEYGADADLLVKLTQAIQAEYGNEAQELIALTQSLQNFTAFNGATLSYADVFNWVADAKAQYEQIAAFCHANVDGYDFTGKSAAGVFADLFNFVVDTYETLAAEVESNKTAQDDQNGIYDAILAGLGQGQPYATVMDAITGEITDYIANNAEIQKAISVGANWDAWLGTGVRYSTLKDYVVATINVVLEQKGYATQANLDAAVATLEGIDQGLQDAIDQMNDASDPTSLISRIIELEKLQGQIKAITFLSKDVGYPNAVLLDISGTPGSYVHAPITFTFEVSATDAAAIAAKIVDPADTDYTLLLGFTKADMEYPDPGLIYFPYYQDKIENLRVLESNPELRNSRVIAFELASGFFTSAQLQRMLEGTLSVQVAARISLDGNENNVSAPSSYVTMAVPAPVTGPAIQSINVVYDRVENSVLLTGTTVLDQTISLNPFDVKLSVTPAEAAATLTVADFSASMNSKSRSISTGGFTVDNVVASGTEVTVSITPDKSVLTPDYLSNFLPQLILSIVKDGTDKNVFVDLDTDGVVEEAVALEFEHDNIVTTFLEAYPSTNLAVANAFPRASLDNQFAAFNGADYNFLVMTGSDYGKYCGIACDIIADTRLTVEATNAEDLNLTIQRTSHSVLYTNGGSYSVVTTGTYGPELFVFDNDGMLSVDNTTTQFLSTTPVRNAFRLIVKLDVMYNGNSIATYYTAVRLDNGGL